MVRSVSPEEDDKFQDVYELINEAIKLLENKEELFKLDFKIYIQVQIYLHYFTNKALENMRVCNNECCHCGKFNSTFICNNGDCNYSSCNNCSNATEEYSNEKCPFCGDDNIYLNTFLISKNSLEYLENLNTVKLNEMNESDKLELKNDIYFKYKTFYNYYLCRIYF